MKRNWCLLLSLCLCAALCVPALAAGAAIAPYTIKGRDLEGNPFSVTFSAASARKATVTQIWNEDAPDEEEYPVEKRQSPVIVLTLCPGSFIKVDEGTKYDDGEPFVSAISGYKDSEGFHMTQHEAAFVYSGTVERLFWFGNDEPYEDANKYGFFVNTTSSYTGETGETYLLELGDTSAPVSVSSDGYGVVSVSYKKGWWEEDYPKRVVTFEAAKTERKAIMLRGYGEDFDAEDGEDVDVFSPYESKEVTIVKLKPGSRMFHNGSADEYPTNSKPVMYNLPAGYFTEGNFYTTVETGAASITFMEGLVDENFRHNDFQANSQYFWGLYDEKNLFYVIQLDTSSDFTDVSEYAYYTYPMIWAVNRGITNGTTATTFSPNNPCTRAQILTFIWRYSGKPEPTVSNPFRDVSPDNYYYKAALWAYEKGMVSGTAFAGDTPCTRLAAVTYLWMLDGRPEYDLNEQYYRFTDLGGMEYPEAVAFAIAKGITQGTSETTFSPDRICTRAHIVTFLQRYDEYVTAKQNAE